MDLADPSYLKLGSSTQIKAYKALRELKVFERLTRFDPVLAGTFPLDLVVKGSDLDILCEVHDLHAFKDQVTQLYAKEPLFAVKFKVIREVDVIIIRFEFDGLPVEIFGQAVPVREQDAFRHLLTEYHLLQGELKGARKNLIALKQTGRSTEAAFAELLGLKGDPYLELLLIGKKLGLYS